MPVAEPHRFLLPRVLYSLSQQTYLPEILVVNDAPDSFAIPGIRVIHTGGNKGTSYARNLGLDAVRTPFTFFMDADDYLLDTAIETFLRAYADYDACYLYSDWYQFGKNHEYSHHKAKLYDRKRQLRHSIHLVNIFLETDTAKSVYYDINYRGWEDWAFHIELGQRGFCGARIPEALLVYDMTTSINREKHNGMQDEVYNEILNRYQDYLEGVKEFMPCSTCGGGKNRAQAAVQMMPPAPQDGMVVLEYLGQNLAPIPYRVGKNIYKGANDEAFKFVQVRQEDVTELLNRGNFRRVAKAATVTLPPPSPTQFDEWRQVQAPMPPTQDWLSIFQKGATAITNQPEEPKKKRQYRKRVKPEEAIEPITESTNAS